MIRRLLLVASLLGLGCTAGDGTATQTTTSSSTITSSPGEGERTCEILATEVSVDPSVLPDADSDVIVFLDLGVSDEDLSGVRAELEALGAVDYVDADRTLAEFEELFGDQPEIVDTVGAADLPTSFRLDLVDPSAFPGDRIETLPGVREIVTPFGSSDAAELPALPAASVLVSLWYPRATDIAIFFQSGSTEVTRAPVLEAMEEQVDNVVFVDEEASYEEFLVLFGDRPDVIDAVDPSTVPVSLRGLVPRRVDVSDLETLPGVREVVTFWDELDLLYLVAFVVDPDIGPVLTELPSLDVADDAAVLVDAVHRWVGTPDDERTRGGAFTDAERARSIAAASSLAEVAIECGLDPLAVGRATAD